MPLNYKWAVTSTFTFTIVPTVVWLLLWPRHVLYQLSYLMVAHVISLIIMYKSRKIVKKYRSDDYVIASLHFYKPIVEVFICINDLSRQACCP